MNDKRYKYILYIIVAVIVATIGIQVYWNYKNYLSNQKQLINDVQTSLDKAVDDYYAALAERTTFGIFLEGDQQKTAFGDKDEVENFLKNLDALKNTSKSFNIDTFSIRKNKDITILRGLQVDSMERVQEQNKFKNSKDRTKRTLDSLKLHQVNPDKIKEINVLTSKIIVSISNDTLNLSEIDSLFKGELSRKQIDVNYQLIYHPDLKNANFKADSLSKDKTFNIEKNLLSTSSKSTFLPDKSELKINFNNATLTILKRILSGIIISAVLILAVVTCLFYLLKIIKQQKQLAEVKNDLISNITHEFKTPIATIGVALESISSFNVIEDKAKTKTYIDMSSEQLRKLNIMVEKLLETATLDSNSLGLNRGIVDVVELLNTIVNNYKIQNPEKTFQSNIKLESLPIEIDLFHFENALNNILDNAVKYGGERISVQLEVKEKSLEILISDNGTILTAANKERIFEKFYRVPKGNTHDVKGFGIGLYYSKSIIEKHEGSIDLDLSKNLTTFKITLPHGQ